MRNLLNFKNKEIKENNLNLPVLMENQFNNLIKKDKRKYICPQKRKDSLLEELILSEKTSFELEEWKSNKSKDDKDNISKSLCLSNETSVIFDYDNINHYEKEDMYWENELVFNDLETFQEFFQQNEKTSVKLGISKKIKKRNYNKLKYVNYNNDNEKIHSKLLKTKSYWEKNNYFLIPNIFKWLTKIKSKNKFYKEHIDYSRKEIWVNPNGEKVNNYLSLFKKNIKSN